MECTSLRTSKTTPVIKNHDTILHMNRTIQLELDSTWIFHTLPSFRSSILKNCKAAMGEGALLHKQQILLSVEVTSASFPLLFFNILECRSDSELYTLLTFCNSIYFTILLSCRIFFCRILFCCLATTSLPCRTQGNIQYK